jgi:probable HAF family extracellular repeat protein
MQDLGVPFGYSTAFARDINDSGAVVGYAGVGPASAFLYRNGVMTDLGSLGTPLSVAEAINNLGQVTGYSRSPATGGRNRVFRTAPYQPINPLTDVKRTGFVGDRIR